MWERPCLADIQLQLPLFLDLAELCLRRRGRSLFQEGFTRIPDRGTYPTHYEPSPAPYLLCPSPCQWGLYLPARWIPLLKAATAESSGGPHLPEEPRRSKQLRVPLWRLVLQKQVCPCNLCFMLKILQWLPTRCPSALVWPETPYLLLPVSLQALPQCYFLLPTLGSSQSELWSVL